LEADKYSGQKAEYFKEESSNQLHGKTQETMRNVDIMAAWQTCHPEHQQFHQQWKWARCPRLPQSHTMHAPTHTTSSTICNNNQLTLTTSSISIASNYRERSKYFTRHVFYAWLSIEISIANNHLIQNSCLRIPIQTSTEMRSIFACFTQHDSNSKTFYQNQIQSSKLLGVIIGLTERRTQMKPVLLSAELTIISVAIIIIIIMTSLLLHPYKPVNTNAVVHNVCYLP